MFLSYRLFFVDDTFAQYYYQSRHMASPRPSPPSLRAEAEPCSSSQPPEVVLGNTFVPVLLSLIPCPTPSWQSDGRRDHLMMLTRQLNICIFWQISFIEPWFSWFSCLIHDSQCPCDMLPMWRGRGQCCVQRSPRTATPPGGPAPPARPPPTTRCRGRGRGPMTGRGRRCPPGPSSASGRGWGAGAGPGAAPRTAASWRPPWRCWVCPPAGSAGTACRVTADSSPHYCHSTVLICLQVILTTSSCTRWGTSRRRAARWSTEETRSSPAAAPASTPGSRGDQSRPHQYLICMLDGGENSSSKGGQK